MTSQALLEPKDPARQRELALLPRWKPARVYRAAQRIVKKRDAGCRAPELEAIARAIVDCAKDPTSRYFMDAVGLLLRADPDLRRIAREEAALSAALPGASAPRIVINTGGAAQGIAVADVAAIDANSGDSESAGKIFYVAPESTPLTVADQCDIVSQPAVEVASAHDGRSIDVQASVTSGAALDARAIAGEMVAELLASRAVLAAQMARIDAVLARAGATSEHAAGPI